MDYSDHLTSAREMKIYLLDDKEINTQILKSPLSRELDEMVMD